MRIGIFLYFQHDGRGGVESVLLHISRELERRGHFCKLYFAIEPKLSSFTKHFKHIFIANEIPFFLKNKSLLRPRALYYHCYRKAFASCIKQIQEDQLDTLLVANISSLILHKKLDKYAPLFNSLSIPILAYPHGSLSPFFKAFPTFSNHLQQFDGILSISSGIINEIRHAGISLPAYTIYNPIPDSLPINRTNNQKRFIYVGRFDEGKRILQLLHILSKVTGNWHADFIGSAIDPQYDNEIKKMVAKLNLTNKITFHGWHENPWSILSDASALLLHSQWEGFPLVLGEAMMRGVPCVAADCPTGPRDIIQNDVNGWLYDMNDENACVRILQEIVDDIRPLPSPEQVHESVQHLLPEKVVEKILAAINDVIEKKKQQ